MRNYFSNAVLFVENVQLFYKMHNNLWKMRNYFLICATILKNGCKNYLQDAQLFLQNAQLLFTKVMWCVRVVYCKDGRCVGEGVCLI